MCSIEGRRPTPPRTLLAKKNDMKHILLLALVVSPAFADVYKCKSGSKTIYQDSPCPNAKVIDNVNALAPAREEQIKAMQRTIRERDLVERLNKNNTREAKESTVTFTEETLSPRPATPKTNRPDRYYDRPDRFNNRTTTTTTIQNR